MDINSSTATKYPSDFIVGLQSGISIAVGYVPIALTFGLLARSTDLTFLETVMMSAVVFAGASQFVALNLIALGTGGLEIVLATFIINFRHLLLTASINEKASPSHRFTKAIYAFGITDETFSVASTSGRAVTTGYIFGLNVVAYSSWVICSAAGFYMGSALPHALQQSMGIALYAMFIGLLAPSLKRSRKVLCLAAFAALFHTAFSYFMNEGWAIVSATLLSAVLAEIIWEGRKQI